MKLIFSLILLAAVFAAVAGSQTPTPSPTPQCQSMNGLPDAKCTPGAIRTTDLNMICHQPTSKIRPPQSYTSPLKRLQMKQYGLTGKLSLFEEDHLISLELGGDPRSPLNLWPQAWAGQYGAHAKDTVENATHRLVCSGKMPIADAQAQIAADWIGLGRREGVIK